MIIDPEYFVKFAIQFPEITAINVELKKGRYTNEINQFRYDVTLYKNKSFANIKIDNEIDWQKQSLSIEQIEKVLSSNYGMTISIKNISNHRLQPFRECTLLPNKAISPAQIYELVERFNLHCITTWSNVKDPFLFDAIISPYPCISHLDLKSMESVNLSQPIINRPYEIEFHNMIINDLYNFLKHSLPELICRQQQFLLLIKSP